jgi:hypothetical protein
MSWCRWSLIHLSPWFEGLFPPLFLYFVLTKKQNELIDGRVVPLAYANVGPADYFIILRHATPHDLILQTSNEASKVEC